MGYTSRNQYRQVEFGLDIVDGTMSVTTTPADIGEFTCALPVINGIVMSAYFDLNMCTAINTFIGANQLVGTTYIKVKNQGGAYQNAIKFLGAVTDMDIAPKNALSIGRIYGNYDLASLINFTSGAPGGVLIWKWALSQALANTIDFVGAVQPIIRLWLR